MEQALRNSGGIQSLAADKLKVNRSTICRFVNKHPDLRIVIEDVTDEITDLAEGQLIVAIRSGAPWAVKLWLESRGQSRGYGTRKLAFKNEDGSMVVPAMLVHNGKMTEDEWAATPWAQQREEATVADAPEEAPRTIQ